MAERSAPPPGSASVPDRAIPDTAEVADAVIPGDGHQTLHVVGLGGSAGAIQALQTFFRKTPLDTGAAFVVVMHLSPEHESSLPELLQACTSMPVIQVTTTVRMQANRVYVIPPGKSLESMDGSLQLTEMVLERHRNVAVDQFFRTLADTHGPHATAVVLSGADGDGAIGIKRIKERGGLTIAQDPEEAEVGGMPRAAIATGMVDWVLRLEEMPGRIADYQRREAQLRLPPEKPQPDRPTAEAQASIDEESLREVLTFLRTRTGREFSSYKRATILRRLGRRMQVNDVGDLASYFKILRTRPGESGALLQDLLISVTNFFRDAEAFDALRSCLLRMLREKGDGGSVRVWVAACATGEEAYSLAMLLTEYASSLDAPPTIQVFATDLDEQAIRVAREGVYPTTIEGDVSEERLRRFFVKDHRGWRVRRELREMVLFAVHDVLKDSPFSRVDLVSCRNLMIYLNRDAQARVLQTFHFALQTDGLLFLGSSESVEDSDPLFSVIDKKHRIYSRRGAPATIVPVPEGPGTLALALAGPSAPSPFHTSMVTPANAAVPAQGLPPGARGATWAELHVKLIERLAPPSLLINAEHDLMHISPTASRFLQFSGGEPSRNLLRTIHPSLRIELRAALYRASQEQQTVDVPPLAINLGSEPVSVAMRVIPVDDLAPGLLLVLLRTAQSAPPTEIADATATEPLDAHQDTVARHLDRELERLKAHLRDTVEQYEASNEELKASNEELHAMNEELRSATEELETSREELQSINEELTTVNYELKSKVEELGHANSDMQNLMDATAIATVFLDRNLRITRFTPSAIDLFHLIPTDIGRPLSDLKTQLDYPLLSTDARQVLERLIPVEREVSQANGSWFLVRALPYRTLDDHIAGVVLTFVDITERKTGQEALRVSEERFAAIVNEARMGVVQTTLAGVITFANPHYAKVVGYTQEELAGKAISELIHPDDRALILRRLDQIERTATYQFEPRGLRRDGSSVPLYMSINLLMDGHASPVSALILCHDISERKQAEAELEASRSDLIQALKDKEQARAALEVADAGKDQFIAVLSHELRNPLAAIQGGATLMSLPDTSEADRNKAGEIVLRQSVAMKVLLDDLLDVTRLHMGKLKLQLRAVRIDSVVESALQTVRPLAQARRQQLRVEIDRPEATIVADAVRLAQVLSNLLSNSVKYTPEEGHIELEVSTDASAEQMTIVVRDDGIGMNPELLQTMFEMFSQGKDVEGATHGLGIGLALVRSVIELHGGTVSGTSDGAGKGSVFTIQLPYDAKIRAPASASSPESSNGPASLTLLVVDDSVDAAWTVAQVLEHAGHRVDVARDGPEALRMVQSKVFDGALIDIGMPHMDGLELARALRASAAGARMLLVATTGWGRERDVQATTAAGFDAHLTKPIDIAELQAILARELYGRHAARRTGG